MKSSLAFLRDHVGPVVVAFAIALAIAQADFVKRFENVTLDRRTIWRAALQRGYVPEPVVIGIDDASIEAVGLWPWKRHWHASFMQNAAHAKPSVIAWDILFAEPDLTQPDNDQKLLGGTLLAQRAGAEVVFGAVSNEEPGMSTLRPLTEPMSRVEGDIQRIHGEKALLPPLPELQEIAHFGAVDTPPGDDGVRRVAPLLVRASERVYPSLSLQAVFRHYKIPLDAVRVRLGDGIYFPGPNGERRIPIDITGGYFVNYRFGVAEPPNTLGFVEMIDAWNKTFVGKQPVPGLPDVAGKILIVGQTSTGLTDMGPTPFSGHTPLVLVHANVIDNILRNDFARQASTLWIWLGAVALSVGGLAVFSKRQLLAQGAFALVLPLVYAAAAFYAWVSFNLWVPIVWPLLGFAGVQVFMISRRLIAEQRAKAEIKGMFGTYLSPALVNRMVESGERPRLGGHAEDITAYFSDIQGFSSFSEKLPPDRLVELMNEYLTACTDIVQEEGGTLDKYIGDAVVAMFGAPIALPDHAYRACVATQRVHQKLGELREKWKAEGDTWPEIVWKMQSRIGLNSGSCIIGNIGSRTRFNYTMMGDNVNLAARMESGAKSWGVYSMCAEATKIACEHHGGDRVIFRPLGRIVVMGRSQAVPIYEIAGLKESIGPEARECLRIFNTALDHYYARDWAAAKAGFELSATLEPNQPGRTPGVKSNPSLEYLRILREYKDEPPPENWGGVYVMKEK